MKPNNYCGDAVNSKYRTADGSCNNVAGDDPDKAKWGQVSTCKYQGQEDEEEGLSC